MTRVQKVLVNLGALVVVTPVAELIREKIVYDRFSSRLANASSSLRPGADKDRVRQVGGYPEWINVYEGVETWHWAAAEHQGTLWQLLGLTWGKGHRTLEVSFNREGKMVDLSDGIN